MDNSTTIKLSKSEANAPVRFVAYGQTRQGGRRENQDSMLSAQTPFGLVVTVCDGMGGGPGGKTASSIAVREIVAGISEASAEDERLNIVIKAVHRANMAIYETACQQPPLQGMGSTATVLLINEHSAIVAHVGDSRIYQLRGRRKAFRTFDHSMVFDLVRQQVITEEQARLSAQSNVITRALGLRPEIDVEAHELPYEKGDRFVLCTDGIHGTMPERELIKMLAHHGSPLPVVLDNIATTIDDLGRDNGGGHDNLTIAIVDTKINSNLQPPMSKQNKVILLALAALCLISLAFNIVQACQSEPQAQEQQTIGLPAASAIDSICAEVDSLASDTNALSRQGRAEALKPTLKQALPPPAPETAEPQQQEEEKM